MIITCNECESSFQVDDRLIQETGSKVRCSKCSAVFVVYPQADEAGAALETDGDAESEDLGLDLGLDLEGEESDDDLSVTGLDAEESELDLSAFDENDDDQSTEVSETLDSDELELDLNLDAQLDEDADTASGETGPMDDELPDLGDLGDLAELDDEQLSEEELDAELEDLDSELAGLDIDLDGDDDADEDLDLGALDLEEEEEAEPEPVQAQDSEDLELDLDFEDQDGTAKGDEVVETDELDLSDLELELGDETDADAGDEAGGEDLELDLGDETEATEDQEVVETDELDLSDLELELGDEAEAGSESAAVDEGLELDLGEQPEDIAAVAAPADQADGELDLSDLEELVDSDKAVDTPVDAGDELDLEFQIGEDGETADEASATGADEELDLSDISEMLESDESPAAESADEKEGEELELEFDIGDEKTTDDEMLDIEQMLEDGEDAGTRDEKPPGGTQELDLELESAADEPDTIESDLELDLESELAEQEQLFEDDAAAGAEQLESNLLSDDDMESLDEVESEELEFAGADGNESAISDDFATDDFSESDDFGQTSVLPEEDDQAAVAAAGPAPTAPKVRSKKPVMIGFLVLVLISGILIVPKMLGVKIPFVSDIKIPFLSDVDMRIPFLSDLINPEQQDVAGNLKINPLGRTINGRFVENAKVGRLFVIQGKIRNDYDHPRSFIKVTGRIFQKGGREVKKATVYCGNVLSGKELSAMNMAAIQKRLKNRFGDRRSNVKVPKGRMVPFMIVFDRLPANLDEFSVEVAGSSI